MAVHELLATPDTVRLGVFSAKFAPVLSVASGDTVKMQCVSGRPEVVPRADSGLVIPEALQCILDSRGGESWSGHIVTGPVAIEGAEPGDMLEVRIESVEPGADWGYNVIRPLVGTLPEDFHETHLIHIKVDRARGVCTLPWGAELALSPFFGVMGVAPPPAFGTISSIQPRVHGGNMDNKALVAGTKLFLPVWTQGALFCAGDGHGLQGDGEVCVSALEICMDGAFTFILHKGAGLGAPAICYPRAETPTHFITMGFNEDLDQAMKHALREMIGFICDRTDLSREQAYAFCSLAVDFHVTQTVNGVKGIHGMLDKAHLA